MGILSARSTTYIFKYLGVVSLTFIKEYDMSEIISNQELLVSNMLEIQALIRILKRKGITDENEILEEVKLLKAEMGNNIKKMGREN